MTDLVGVIDLLEVRGAVIAITNIGVILKRETAIRLLDLVLGSARANAKGGIGISSGCSIIIRHGLHPCFRPRTAGARSIYASR